MQHVQSGNNKTKGAQQQADADEAAQNWPGCFRHVARCRRLNKEEVVLILSNPAKFGLVRTEVLPAEGISSGTVYLCSKDRVRVLKHDGIDYVKRNAAQGSNRIREDVVKMKVNGRHAVNSYSSRGSGSACFWRRRYALEPPAASSSSSKTGRGHQNVVWGDQLVHYLDDEEARGFARRSPFGAAGVARPLTSEECWRGRGTQLPPDGNLFLAATRRETRREDLAAAAAVVAKSSASLPSPASSSSPLKKTLSSSRMSSSVKKEDESVRAGGLAGGRSWIGSAGKVVPGSRSCGSGGGSARYGGPSGLCASGAGDLRSSTAQNTSMWGGVAGGGDALVIANSNGHAVADAMATAMASPASTRLAGGGNGQAGGVGGMSFWDAKKGTEFNQQQAVSSALNHGGMYDDIVGLEFEGLGAGDVSGGAGGSHTDDDMNDLFRSFLVDGDDLLNAPSSQGNHTIGNQSAPASAALGQVPTELPAPAGFSLRNSSGGVGRVGGGTYEADDGVRGMRRRANTSPDCDDISGGSSAQGLRLADVPFRPISPQGFVHRSTLGTLPALVGSPPRRESRPAAITQNKSLHSHGSIRGGGSSPSPRCFSAWRGGGVASASATSGSDSCPPGPLQLSSPWAQSFASGVSSGAGAAMNSSPSPGRRPEAGGGAAAPTLSPPGASSSALFGSGGSAGAIVDFSPTWDFAPGGAKLLICLASPLDAEVGSLGPVVYFADCPVQSELVSQTVVRCKVPPGPSGDGTVRVPVRVEVPSHSNGLRRSNSNNAGFDGGSRGRGQAQGVVVFEYREPASSPSNSAPALSRCGTPRTPGRLLTWQELPEDGWKSRKGVGARKREWGELTSGTQPPPLEAVSSAWADRARHGISRSSTPRPRETPPWGSSARVSGRVVLGSAPRRGSPPGSWRRASADFGQLAVPPEQLAEDSLGYALMPCDGRECKIRIVERLEEISGSRANGAAGEEGAKTDSVGGGGGSGSAPGELQEPWTRARAGGGCSDSGSINGSTMSRDNVQQTSLGREGSMSSSGLGVGDLDDMALNELGDTELEGLLEEMWMKVMGQLTDLESELNALDSRGFSVLHYTCLHNLSALVPVLLERGADVNLKTDDGHDQTPLHLAARGGNIGIAQELYKKGAAVDAVDAHGLTADKLAGRCNHRDVALWLWAQSRSGCDGGDHPQSSCSSNSSCSSSNNPSTSSAPTAAQNSPATPLEPPSWAGGVSPAGAGCPPSPCPPPSPWGGEGWQALQSPPAAPGETPPPPPEQLSASGGTRGFSPAHGNSGDNAAGGADELPAFMGQEWGPGNPSVNSGKAGAADSIWSTLEEAGGGVRGNRAPWGLDLPPPGGGINVGVGEMDEAEGNGGVCQGSEEEESEHESSMERLLRDAFSSLSLHEKCAISLHVSQRQQQQHQQTGTSVAAGGDASSGGVKVSEVSGLSKVLEEWKEGGLREEDIRAIMSMMGPSDLSEVEDEVKVIQQDVRAWILRCNYKSLRKAARTLQVAWRERQRYRIEEDTAMSTISSQRLSLSRMSSRSGIFAASSASGACISGSNTNAATNANSMSNSLMADGGGGPEPMDESGDAFPGGARDVTGTECGSDAGGGGAGGNSGGSNSSSASCCGNGTGSAGAGLTLGGAGALAEERVTREERAAKALQSAARVMLARKGRFQRLARETQALLVIQRRSREWLKQKQTSGSDASADAPYSQGL